MLFSTAHQSGRTPSVGMTAVDPHVEINPRATNPRVSAHPPVEPMTDACARHDESLAGRGGCISGRAHG
jgi:hypothetical protein